VIGEVLDGWKLVRKLGEGASGETYWAEHGESAQKAAAKVLFPQPSADAASVEKLFADANAASRVNHVSMTDVYACGLHANQRAFVVMELLEGKNLTDALVELGAVSDVASFADIGWQLATGLAAAHGARLVHRGLKPDAIFLTFPPGQAPRPQVRVLDFGMAKFSVNLRHSQTGSLLGAPLYMPPEIGRGLPNVDHRADIYALGCIFFEMLCGRPPFVREGVGELIIAHASEPPPPVASLEPSVPQAIANLIGRMLTKNPVTRPQSMGEVAGLLEKFFDCPAPGIAPSVTPPYASASVAPTDAVAVAPTPQAPALAQAATPLGAQDSAPFRTPVAPVPPSHRQDPTALLPPGEGPPVAFANRSAAAPPSLSWTARVQQRTAILDPPNARHLSEPQRPRRPVPNRASPAPAVEAVPRLRRLPPLNIPIAVISASVVLIAGSLAMLLARKSPAKPVERPAPAVVERPPPEPTGFAPPRPAPVVPPPTVEAQAAPEPAPSPRAAGQVSAKPVKKGPAKRW
jgi:serine/threonine protein kinase